MGIRDIVGYYRWLHQRCPLVLDAGIKYWSPDEQLEAVKLLRVLQQGCLHVGSVQYLVIT